MRFRRPAFRKAGRLFLQTVHYLEVRFPTTRPATGCCDPWPDFFPFLGASVLECARRAIQLGGWRNRYRPADADVLSYTLRHSKPVIELFSDSLVLFRTIRIQGGLNVVGITARGIFLL